MEEPVRLGLVGLGRWGQELMRGAESSGTAHVVAGFARTPRSRHEFARQNNIPVVTSYAELLADDSLEAVVIATSHSSHASLAREALDHGKHVFVDKPFTLTVEDGRRVIADAEAAELVLQVGHNRRRQVAARRMKAAIEAGVLGTVVVVEANHSGSGGLRRRTGHWRTDPAESPLAGMTGMGVHQLDTMQYLLGAVTAVSAHANSLLEKSALDTVAVLGLEFALGAMGTLVTSNVVPATVRLGVMGTSGAIWSADDGLRLTTQTIEQPRPTEEVLPGNDTIADQMAEFARCVRSGDAPETGGREGLRVVAVMEAAIRAVKERTVVPVEQVV